MKTLTIMLSIASVIVIIGMLLGLYRGIKGPDGASRVAVNDLIFYAAGSLPCSFSVPVQCRCSALVRYLLQQLVELAGEVS